MSRAALSNTAQAGRPDLERSYASAGAERYTGLIDGRGGSGKGLLLCDVAMSVGREPAGCLDRWRASAGHPVAGYLWSTRTPNGHELCALMASRVRALHKSGLRRLVVQKARAEDWPSSHRRMEPVDRQHDHGTQ